MLPLRIVLFRSSNPSSSSVLLRPIEPDMSSEVIEVSSGCCGFDMRGAVRKLSVKSRETVFSDFSAEPRERFFLSFQGSALRVAGVIVTCDDESSNGGISVDDRSEEEGD